MEALALITSVFVLYGIRCAWLLHCAEQDIRELREELAWKNRPGVKGAATKRAYQRENDPILKAARNG